MPTVIPLTNSMPQNALLELHDDPVRWKHPSGFDTSLAANRFRSFVAILNETFPGTFRSETGFLAQDASFHSQILLSDAADEAFFMRFSNFGDMVAYYADGDTELDFVAVLHELLERYKYALLPFEILAVEYTGRNPGVIGIDTWWTRYFGWVA